MNLFTVLIFIMFIIFIAAITLIQYRQRNQAKRNNELSEFIYGSKSEKKIYEITSWKHWYDTIFFLIAEIEVIIGISLSKDSIPVLWINTGKYIDQIPGIQFSSYIALVALLSIVFAIKKQKYFTFSIQDIFEEYRLKFKFILMLCNVVVAYIMLFLGIVFRNMELSYLYFGCKLAVFFCFVNYLYIFTKIIYIIINFVLDTNIEKSMLNKLYREYWYKQVEHDSELITQVGTTSSMDYLLDVYFENAKKINIKSIDKIRFDSTLSTNKDVKEQKKHMLIKCYVKCMLTLVFFYLLMNINLVQSNLLKFCVPIGIVFLASLIVILISESNRDALVRVFYDRKGYFIYSKKILSNKYVTDVPLNIREGSWHKYIISLKNIVRLYDIVSEYDKKNGEELHKEIYKHCDKFVNEKIEHNDNKKYTNMLMITIMEIIDFCNYKYFEEIDSHKCNNIDNNVQSLIEAVILDIYGEPNDDGILVNETFFEYKKNIGKVRHK